MRVGYASNDYVFEDDGAASPGGCAWYRCVLPGEALKEYLGWPITYGVDVAVDTGSGQLGVRGLDSETVDWDCDIVVLQRWMARSATEVVERARSCGQVIVQDVDDLFWELSPHNAAHQQSDPRHNREVNRRHYLNTIAASSAVTVSTPYLAKRLEHLNVPVVVVRNAIDLDRWTYLAATTPKAKRDWVGVGWHGMLSHRSGDLPVLREGLTQFLARHPICNPIHIGHKPHAKYPNGDRVPTFAEELGLDRDRVGVIPPVALSQLPAKIAKHFDIGVVPLAPHPFNEAKSFIKGLEYASAGVPFVASGTAEYQHFGAGIVVSNKAGKHATRTLGTAAARKGRANAWCQALERLLDPVERKILIRKGYEAAETHSIDVRWKEWAAAFEDFAGF